MFSCPTSSSDGMALSIQLRDPVVSPVVLRTSELEDFCWRSIFVALIRGTHPQLCAESKGLSFPGCEELTRSLKRTECAPHQPNENGQIQLNSVTIGESNTFNYYPDHCQTFSNQCLSSSLFRLQVPVIQKDQKRPHFHNRKEFREKKNNQKL
jgi:hypothetical protein